MPMPINFLKPCLTGAKSVSNNSGFSATNSLPALAAASGIPMADGAAADADRYATVQ